MCGICGIYHFKNNRIVESDQIQRMNERLAHRGPDDSGTYFSPDRKLGLGHRRLSIIDLSPAGHQPMEHSAGNLQIVYNGEIYNHQHLRQTLEKQGHSYMSHSDTETILNLYQEYGIEALKHLRGMFALAIWDHERNELTLARDRVGIKPLYYTIQDGTLIFASEIKAILSHPLVSAEIDPQALYHYLTLAAAPAPLTMFAGIKKLPAGYWMRVDGSGRITYTRWWDAIRNQPMLDDDEATISRGILDHLRDSVKSHMISDVPFGVFLSGGIDSTTNVALMAELMDRPVQTFSVSITGQDQFNEFEYARRMAKHFHCDHHEVEIGDEHFISLFEQLAYLQDEPLADPVCVPLYYVSQLARQNGVPVIQVGEGADELFCGYPKFLLALQLISKWDKLQFVPKSIWHAGYRMAGRIMESKGRYLEREHLRRLSKREELFWGGAIAFLEYEKDLLLSSEMRNICRDYNTAGQIAALYEPLNGSEEYFTRMTYLELKQRLPELLLMRVDKMAMAHSIETRVPFLDHLLIEYVLRIPSKMHYRNDSLKYLLKKAVTGIVPDEILNRPKVGFCGSAKNMVSPGVDKFAYELLTSKSNILGEIVNREYVDRVFARHQGGNNQGMRIWNLLNLALWYRQWINKPALSEV
ncbi:MAG: asparagine synthase (glutamine-hydrolyzing) [bacterium]|nr:asparagine synthase (glutamine-hydrolyzing) [bacterium]